VRKRPVALTAIGFLIKAFINLFLKENWIIWNQDSGNCLKMQIGEIFSLCYNKSRFSWKAFRIGYAHIKWKILGYQCIFYKKK
jgi:hypothetical protein